VSICWDPGCSIRSPHGWLVGVIPDRLVSLCDPDARPIRKGKPQHPTQFGYTLLLGEDERGFIADHQLQQGNPPDAAQLVPAVERVVEVTGRVPGTVVGDRGFGIALKRGFGLCRTRLRRLAGARTWVGLGVFRLQPAADDGDRPVSTDPGTGISGPGAPRLSVLAAQDPFRASSTRKHRRARGAVRDVRALRAPDHPTARPRNRRLSQCRQATP